MNMVGVRRVAAGRLALLLALLELASSVDLARHRAFADELTSNLYQNANECTSALGVSMAFSLIWPGCTGDAINQVRDTLGYSADTNMQLVWEETTQRMLGRSTGECVGGEWDGNCNSEAPLLKIANSVWLDDGSTLHPDYELVVGQYAKQIDLAAGDSPLIVNGWVKNQTNGLIEQIVDESQPLFPPYELISVNSIYLKASWQNPFKGGETNVDTFYTSIARKAVASKAHFMHKVLKELPYSHDILPGYQVAQLPFAESKMSMILVLPLSEGGEGAGPVLSSKLLPALNGLQSTRVALAMPKFRFESTYDGKLKEAVISTGIVAPFRGGSLCGLFEDDGNCGALFIDKIIQKTVIEVNEEGVEAAAVTAIMIGRASAPLYEEEPVLMQCDHPFQFFIYDETEDLVLFEGRVGAPEVPKAKPEVALLKTKHSDKAFWPNNFGVNPTNPPGASQSNPSDSGSSSFSIKGFVSSKRRFLSLVIGAVVAYVVGLIL